MTRVPGICADCTGYGELIRVSSLTAVFEISRDPTCPAYAATNRKRNPS